MRKDARPVAMLLAVISAIAILLSCSPTNPAPEKGTPAFYWAAAKETWAAGDVIKTLEHLDKICATDNEYTKRAQPWLLIVTAGLSRGNAELAENYEFGARNNRAEPAPFRKQMSQTRNVAARAGLQFAEGFAKFQAGSKDDPVALDFAFPTGSAVPVPQLTKVAKGMMLLPAEEDQVQQRALQRGVILTLTRAVGVPDDSAKVQEMFKPGNVKVPRNVFMLAMAGELYDQSQLYTRMKLDEPQKMQMFCVRAQEALKGVPDSKQTKELNSKILAALKVKKGS